MSRPTTPSADRSARGRCAVCGKPAQPAFTPFCSQGCRDRDLLQWLGEGYRVPGRAFDDEDAEKPRTGVDSERDPPL
ncbi:DNA gyrase inhibitor YacG [Sphingomonas profundi]|uniref:DNA gyrase inhibitor YacG n=1 Tax=Alterirhizorhabdus profundi TaxID=2681549 RepID=UPI0012E8FFC9|nr:DNA gyrase inhibitor YacG [Sphingomonas profundi]